MLQARDAAQATSDLSLQLRVDCQLALQYVDKGAFDQSRDMFDAAIIRLRNVPDMDPGIVAACLNGRSELRYAIGDFPGALADDQSALETLGTPRPSQRAQAAALRGTLAMIQGRIAPSTVAEREFRSAIADLETMGRGNTETARGLYNNLAILLSSAGQTLSSTQAYEKALAAGPTLGTNSTLDANYAGKLIELGRALDAIPLVERALASLAERGNKGEGLARVALLGALAWCDTGDLRMCNGLLTTAEQELTQTTKPGRSIFGTLEMRQGQAAWASGDRAAAAAKFRHAIAIFDSAQDKSRNGIRARTLLARVELELGHRDIARSEASRSVAQAREALAGFTHSQWLGGALVALGLVQQASGESTAAQVTWRAALNELEATMGISAPATEEVRRLLKA